MFKLNKEKFENYENLKIYLKNKHKKLWHIEILDSNELSVSISPFLKMLGCCFSEGFVKGRDEVKRGEEFIKKNLQSSNIIDWQTDYIEKLIRNNEQNKI